MSEKSTKRKADEAGLDDNLELTDEEWARNVERRLEALPIDDPLRSGVGNSGQDDDVESLVDDIDSDEEVTIDYETDISSEEDAEEEPEIVQYTIRTVETNENNIRNLEARGIPRAFSRTQSYGRVNRVHTFNSEEEAKKFLREFGFENASHKIVSVMARTGPGGRTRRFLTAREINAMKKR